MWASYELLVCLPAMAKNARHTACACLVVFLMIVPIDVTQLVSIYEILRLNISRNLPADPADSV